jgi:hypothetical protein
MAHFEMTVDTPQLMTKSLIAALVEHCTGNLRVLNNMSAELLEVGVQKELSQLDEKLFIEIFSLKPSPGR